MLSLQIAPHFCCWELRLLTVRQCSSPPAQNPDLVVLIGRYKKHLVEWEGGELHADKCEGFLCCCLTWNESDAWGLRVERLVRACESAQCSRSFVGTVGSVRSGFSRNLIILNFAFLISLFTQLIEFSAGHLVLCCSFQPRVSYQAVLQTPIFQMGAFEETLAAFRI